MPRTPAEWALIGVNLAPLIGVFFFKWDAFNVILVYWTETAIIGLLGITKIGLSSGKTGFFLVPFFAVHYGGFMFGHLAFLASFAQGKDSQVSQLMQLYDSNGFFTALPFLFSALWLLKGAWVPMMIMHLRDFYLTRKQDSELPENFPGAKKVSEDQVHILMAMIGPYGRIVLMHITIILAGLPTMLLGSPLPALLLLIMLKIAGDIVTHRFFHSKEKKEETRQTDTITTTAIIISILIIYLLEKP